MLMNPAANIILGNVPLPIGRSNIGLGPSVTPQDYGALSNGVANDAAALTAANAASIPIIFYTGNMRIATNTTVTSPFIKHRGCTITVDNCVLTFADFNALKADNIFVCINGGSVVFLDNSLVEGAVDPRWFGALTCDRATVQSGAIQTANVLAFNRANASITSGFVDVRFAGRMCFNATLTVCNARNKGAIGAGWNTTELVFTHTGAMMIAGSGSSTLFDTCYLTGFLCLRTVTPAISLASYIGFGFMEYSTVKTTTTTPPTIANLLTYPIGLIAVGLAGFTVDFVRFSDSMIGFYSRFTSGTYGRELWNVNGTAGVAGDIRVAMYLDGRGVNGNPGNNSFQIIHPLAYKGAFIGKYYGIVCDGRTSTLPGPDMQDIHPYNFETAYADFGLVMSSGGSADTDNKFEKLIIDNCSTVNVYIVGLGVSGSVTIIDSHLTGLTGNAQLVSIDSCIGAVNLRATTFDGASGFASSVGVLTTNTVNGLNITDCNFYNVLYGMQIQGGCVGFIFDNITYRSSPAQTVVNLVHLFAGANNGWVGFISNCGVVTSNIVQIDVGSNNNKFYTPLQIAGASSAGLVNNLGTGNVNLG